MEPVVVFVAYSNWQKVIRAQKSIKFLFPVKLELHEGGCLHVHFFFGSWKLTPDSFYYAPY